MSDSWDYKNVAALKAGLDANLAADLEECIKAADAETPNPSTDSARLALMDKGGKLYVALDDTQGRGPCDKLGVGWFVGDSPSSGLLGNYTIDITRTLAMVKDASGGVVYSGKGLEKGLTGQWPVLVKF